MKALTLILFCIFCSFAFGQPKADTSYLKEQASIYLTKMYIKKQFDSAASMWDKRMFLELEDFYNKRSQGRLTDTTLYKRVKTDVVKYFSKAADFKINSFLRKPPSKYILLQVLL